MKNILKIFGCIAVVFSLTCANVVFSQESNTKTPAFSFRPIEKESKIIHDGVLPGDNVKGFLKVILIDDIPSLFSVSFRDAARGAVSGVAVSGGNSVEDLSLSNWIDLPNGDKFIVDGAGIEDVPYEINVPEGVAPGDYAGLFVATIEDYGEDVSLGATAGGQTGGENLGAGAKVTIGVGVEFVLRVAGEIVPNVELKDMEYFVDDSQRLNLKVSFENKGNVTIVPALKIQITDIFGRRVYNGEIDASLVSPGVDTSASFSIPNEEFNPAPNIYTVDMEFFYKVFNFTTDEDVESENIYSAGVGSIKLYLLPQVVIWSILLLLILVVLLVLYRIYRFYSLSKSSKSYTVKESDTLQSISNKYKVDPKLIIFVNRLKKPYFLEAGKKILVPKQKKKDGK